MLLQMQVWAFMLLQEAGAPGWDFRHLWEQMGTLAKAVVIVMFLMSAWSIGVMIDRVMAYNAARKQSRAFAPAVAGALREGKLDEAIKIADRYKKSHLAKVVVAGLQEFQAHQNSAEISGEEIEASKRALIRSEAIVHAELKRGVSALATIAWHRRHRGRYFGSPRDHRYRFVRRRPRRLDVQLFHGPHRCVRRGNGELELGAGRLLPEAQPDAGRRAEVTVTVEAS